jgi:hypothetical protein
VKATVWEIDLLTEQFWVKCYLYVYTGKRKNLSFKALRNDAFGGHPHSLMTFQMFLVDIIIR